MELVERLMPASLAQEVRRGAGGAREGRGRRVQPRVAHGPRHRGGPLPCTAVSTQGLGSGALQEFMDSLDAAAEQVGALQGGRLRRRAASGVH